MSVMVATAYMEEAERFDWLVAMDAGRGAGHRHAGRTARRTGTRRWRRPSSPCCRMKKSGHQAIVVPPLAFSSTGDEEDIAIEARGLTMRFGDFVAVDHVSFRIRRGEIFGFLGSNGCGKTTTMKMLTGLLPASEGSLAVRPAGRCARHRHAAARRLHVAGVLALRRTDSVRQNLVLHARLFTCRRQESPRASTNWSNAFG
jgi:ribosome-dependent ATPase